MKVKRVGAHSLPLPSAATAGSAGLDLRACLPDEDVSIDPSGTMAVPCGFAFGFESHQMGMVCSRSGLAAKHNVFVINSPGIVDSDFIGEVKIILHNAGKENFFIKHGDRIAQLLIRTNYAQPELHEVSELAATKRGTGGLGSTGIG